MNPLRMPLAALIAGILASPHLEPQSVWIALPAAAILGCLRPKLLVGAVFLLGSAVRSADEVPPPRLDDDGYPARIIGRIVRAPEPKPGGFTMTLVLESANGVPASGRADVSYFPGTEALGSLFGGLDLGSGDRVEILVRLRPPTVFRNPGGFDYRRFLERQGVYWTGTLRSPRLVRVLERGHHFPDALRSTLADRITARINGGPDVRALALGMVLGQRQGLGPDAERRFERAGLTHLLVVSGFNLAVVAAGALWVGRRIATGRWRRTFRLVFAQIVVLFYAVLVDGDAPVLRAAIMASLLFTGTLIDRGYRISTALTTSVFLILLLDPTSMEETGFLLTSIAVLAIDRLALPIVRWIRDGAGRPAGTFVRVGDAAFDAALPPKAVDWRLARRLSAERSGLPTWIHASGGRILWAVCDVLVVTAAVQSALLPLTVESYHRISFVSLPLNVAGGLTAAIVTPLGLVASLLPGPLAAGPALVMDWSLRGLVAAVDVGLTLPGAVRSIPSPPVWIWCGFGVAIGSLALGAERRSMPRAVTSGLLAAFLVAAAADGDFSPAPPRYPAVTFLDVGQGDSILVELPDGRRILVDGGGLAAIPNLEGSPDVVGGTGGFSVGEDVVVPYLFSRGIRRLDAVVLSHAHRDHMDGLIEVLDRMRVGELWLGPNPRTAGYVRLLEAASRGVAPLRHLRRGDVLEPFRVLHPPPERVVGTSAANDDSLVLLLESPTGSILLPGDLESDLPAAPGRVTVLKVPHHGSRNAAGNLSGALPVISVGARNPFGHPHPSRLPALRTDIVGAIRVELTPRRPTVTFPGL